MFFLLAVVGAEASSCPYPILLDPPTMLRNGADFGGVELPTGSVLQACADICCADPRCVAFSYNNPQPMSSFNCSAGGICCMLKSAVPPLSNNTYGPAVQTGVIANKTAELPPGPTPPFPPSTAILNATLSTTIGFWNGSGDTWPTTWAANGTVYGWPCDSHGSPMGLWRIDGDPFGDGTLTPTVVSNSPIDYMTLCTQYGTPSPSALNVKPGSTMALNDSIYVTVSCMNYGDDSQFNRQHNLGGFIAQSTDGGATFTNVTDVGTAFSGRFSAPVFVSCGQNNDPCRTANAGFLYVFFQAGFDNNAYWCNNDAMFLARVPEVQLANLSAYEFYAGMAPGNGSQPVFVADASQSQPVLTFGRMIGENGITYHPYLQRYLMANFGFIDNDGNPRPWHQKPWMMPHRTQLIMLEAPQPWGPWSIFLRDDNSASAPGLYTPTFPSAYIQPPQGNTAELVMFFSCLGGSDACRYTLNWQTITLTLA